ncbi:MAG TPA: ribosome maturation factor RimP [Burkholderiaceae bacterium]|nr:ribosome maturation factor RimP [Burkholderiaceae bacterium]
MANPQLQALVEQSAQALGLDVVEIERSTHGLLRVFVDRVDESSFVTVEDCERLSRQLSQTFFVENVDYERLEVSSPGLDRPLKKLADYVRFAGQEATVKLRVAVAGQRVFSGIVVAPESQEDGAEPRIGLQVEGARGISLLRFKLDEVERARLVPKIDFKRKAR